MDWFGKPQEQEVQLKRVAAKMSREVKKFWLRINQVITFKQKLEADEARQKVMHIRWVFRSHAFGRLLSFLCFAVTVVVVGISPGDGQTSGLSRQADGALHFASG